MKFNDYKNEENADLVSLLPPLSFEHLFESLSFYIENNTKNQLLQKVMKHVYQNEYIKDERLKGIKDTDNEAIKKDEDGNIQMLITIEEINKAKSIFLNIKDFSTDCESKTY